MNLGHSKHGHEPVGLHLPLRGFDHQGRGQGKQHHLGRMQEDRRCLPRCRLGLRIHQLPVGSDAGKRNF